MASTRSSTTASERAPRAPLGAVGFLFAFFAVLAMPVAQMVLTPFNIAPIDENRKRQPEPVWKGQLHPFLLASELWFNENFGFRPLLIRTKTQIDYSLFGTSDRVHIGRDGFLFFRPVLDLERYQVERLLVERRADVVRGAARLAADLKRRGKQLILLISPGKHVVYPEMLPGSIANFPKVPQLELLRRDFAGLDGVRFVDLLQALLDIKKRQLVYYRTDAHWNSRAGFEMAKLLAATIAREEGRPLPFDAPLETEPRAFSGDVARFLPLFHAPSEITESVKTTWPILPGIKFERSVGPWEYLQWAPKPNGLLPCTAVVGDSFFDGLQVGGFAAYVGGFYRARWHAFAKFSETLDAPAECKYFIFHFVDGNMMALETLANYPGN